jgi:hypothetical protein
MKSVILIILNLPITLMKSNHIGASYRNLDPKPNPNPKPNPRPKPNPKGDKIIGIDSIKGY